MDRREAGRRAGERGQALLEAALAFPLLLTLVLGAIQFGLWYHAQFVVQTACQEGARVAAAEDGTLADGLARARTLLVAGLGPTAQGVAIQGNEDDERTTIAASGSYPTIIPWVNANRLPLQARASMVRERFRQGTGGP
jgi:Flp pilus assembly protein TadG